MSYRTALFADIELTRVLSSRQLAMEQEVDGYDATALLNTGTEELVKYFEEKHRTDPLRLDEQKITTQQDEIQLDARGQPGLLALDESEPIYVQGSSVSVFIPFEGDPDLFKCQPPSFTFDPPHGEVKGQDLVLTYSGVNLDAAQLRTWINRQMSGIRGYVHNLGMEVESFNQALREKARARIEARKQKLIQARTVVENLGFPIRRCEGAPETYAVPKIRKRIVPPPPAPTDPTEPALPSAEYENILSILCNMSFVLERSPSLFADMEEEALRNHFLVQLNGQYEGQAMGETFNYQGKTDILLRLDGKNLFIAECKFWEGPEGFAAAIDQLRGYLTWRDTKAALLIFNRNKNFTAVLEKIQAGLKGHSAFHRTVPQPRSSESEFRCVIIHRDDPQREILLTVLAFDVPLAAAQPESTRAASAKAKGVGSRG